MFKGLKGIKCGRNTDVAVSVVTMQWRVKYLCLCRGPYSKRFKCFDEESAERMYWCGCAFWQARLRVRVRVQSSVQACAFSHLASTPPWPMSKNININRAPSLCFFGLFLVWPVRWQVLMCTRASLATCPPPYPVCLGGGEGEGAGVKLAA